jgi:hypothetical protein
VARHQAAAMTGKLSAKKLQSKLNNDVIALLERAVIA